MKKKNIAERAREYGLDPSVVYRRRRNGWPEKDWYKPLDMNKSRLRKVLPNVSKPKAEPPKPSKLDNVEDGFLLTISIAALGLAIVGLLWLVTK